MKKGFFIFLLVAAVFSCSTTTPDSGKDEGGNPVVTPVTGPVILKLMSFNIRYSNNIDGENGWTYRRAAVREMIAKERPVVMGTQETCSDQEADILADAKGYDCIKDIRDPAKPKGQAMTIFYLRDSIEVVRWGTFWLSKTPDIAGSKDWNSANVRCATWAEMTHKRSGKRFFYINTHLDHISDEARTEGLKVCLAKFEELNTEKLPQILTADFNSRPNSALIVDLRKKMTDAREKANLTDDSLSFNNFTNPEGTTTLDYIFTTGLRPLKFVTLNKPYADVPYISDHYPIYANLQF